MKRRAFILSLVAAAALMVAGLCACSQEEYTPKTLTPTISAPAIQQDGVLRVGVTGSAPFVIETSDDLGGLDVDIAAAIADELGLKLEVVMLGADLAVVGDAIASGQVDIVMSASSADESEAVWVSDTYIQTGVVLFAAEGTAAPSLDDEEYPTVAAQDSSTSAWASINAFGDDHVVASSDLMSAFSAYQSGDAQFVASDAVIGSYVVLYQNLDVVPVAIMGETSGYRIAVAAGNTELQNAVSAALATIKGNGVADLLSYRRIGAVLNLGSLPVIETSLSGTIESASEDVESSEAGSNAVTQDEESNDDGEEYYEDEYYEDEYYEEEYYEEEYYEEEW